MKGSHFVFYYVNVLYYKCHKINVNQSGSYIDSPDWIKNENVTINPINENDYKYFQYATTVALNHEDIGRNSQRISKIKPFTNKYIWEGIHYPSEKDEQKIFEKNNPLIAFNLNG